MPEKEPRPDTEPLVRALNRAGIGGMPAAVWAAIATALAPAGVHYSPADVESFARAHPALCPARQSETIERTMP